VGTDDKNDLLMEFDNTECFSVQNWRELRLKRHYWRYIRSSYPGYISNSTSLR
jgi:hypothetical protein